MSEKIERVMAKTRTTDEQRRDNDGAAVELTVAMSSSAESSVPQTDCVASVTIDIGDALLTLRAVGRPPIVIGHEFGEFLMPFIQKLLARAPEEYVPWQVLNLAAGSPVSSKRNMPATARCRQMLKRLNDKVGGLVDLPEGQPLFPSLRGKGVCLNPRIHWSLGKRLKRLFGSKSVDARLYDPQGMARTESCKGR